jgi:hypothetical protein
MLIHSSRCPLWLSVITRPQGVSGSTLTLQGRQAIAEWLNQVRAGNQEGPKFTTPECLKELRYSEDGLWWRDDALVIPDAGTLRRGIMRDGHDVSYSGNFGVTKTIQGLHRFFWWPACGLAYCPDMCSVTSQATSRQQDCYNRCLFPQGCGTVSHWT